MNPVRQILLIVYCLTLPFLLSSATNVPMGSIEDVSLYKESGKTEFMEKLARKKGKLDKGNFRVVVLEADGRESVKDFTDLKGAKTYADDAASETENGPVYASVFNSEFQVVHKGKHY